MAPASTELYTLSLHDALPISLPSRSASRSASSGSAAWSPRRTPASLRPIDRKSTRLNSSHLGISYAVFCLKKKNAGEQPRENSRVAALAGQGEGVGTDGAELA